MTEDIPERRTFSARVPAYRRVGRFCYRRHVDLFTLTQPLRRRAWLAYALAILLPLAALGVRFLIGPVLSGSPFLTFVPAVLLVAYVGGWGAGLFCATVSGLLASFYSIQPFGAFEFETPDDWIPIVFYAGISLVIIALVDAMNRAHARLWRAERELASLNADLERRVEERTSELSGANARLQAEISARMEAEGRAAQLERMQAIGQLTGGISHDFNNMLGIIVGNLDLAQRKIARGSTDIVRYIDNAMDGARQSAALTQRLLAFARKQPLDPVVTDVNALVSGLSELLRRTLGERIEMECVLAGGLWRTCVDPAQLESAIVNLAVNARDAMPSGGKLTVETMNAHLDEAYAASNVDVIPGQYVCVAATDTGSGMPPNVLARAFEPFFTTKDVGHGTGLGLSQIFGYLKQSGGHAAIYSEEGRGTTVRLYFPRYTGAEEATAPNGAPVAEALLPRGAADEVVLVVEDEAAMRATSVEALLELGYSVRQAKDGAEALRVLAEHSDVALLFTDVVLPGMTGRELADEAERRHPGLKILYTTGYTRNAIVHGGRLDPGVELLSKPFTTDQLARKVRSVLDD